MWPCSAYVHAGQHIALIYAVLNTKHENLANCQQKRWEKQRVSERMCGCADAIKSSSSLHIIFHIFFSTPLEPPLEAQLAVRHPFVRIMRRCQIAKRSMDFVSTLGVHKSETSEWFQECGWWQHQTGIGCAQLLSTLGMPRLRCELPIFTAHFSCAAQWPIPG